MIVCNQCNQEMCMSGFGHGLVAFTDDEKVDRINTYTVYECPNCGLEKYLRHSFRFDPTWTHVLDEEEYAEEKARIEEQADE